MSLKNLSVNKIPKFLKIKLLNKRINKLIDDKKFIKRVFTNKEIRFSKNIKNKTNYYAKRFAAKEAFVKALGTGFRNNINFSDIEVINNKLGKPKINISKKVRTFIKKKFKLDKPKIYVSLSDENKHSIAYVILENT